MTYSWIINLIKHYLKNTNTKTAVSTRRTSLRRFSNATKIFQSDSRTYKTVATVSFPYSSIFPIFNEFLFFPLKHKNFFYFPYN